MKEEILDILEKHYHGRNFIENRCAEELLALLDVSVRYFQCTKCNCKTKTGGEIPEYVCTNSAPHRTSGICGGSFTNEISEAEFNAR